MDFILLKFILHLFVRKIFYLINSSGEPSVASVKVGGCKQRGST